MVNQIDLQKLNLDSTNSTTETLSSTTPVQTVALPLLTQTVLKPAENTSNKAMTLLSPSKESETENLWQSYTQQNEHLKALKCLPTVIKSNVKLALMRLESLASLNKWKELIEQIKENPSLYENQAKAWYLQGKAYQEQKNYEKTIDCLKKCLTLEPKNTQVLYECGQVWFKMHQYQNALQCFEAIEISQRNVPILSEMANCYYQCYRYNQAEEMVKQILKEEPKNFAALLTQGLIHFRRHSREAQEICNQLLLMEPQNTEALYLKLLVSELEGESTDLKGLSACDKMLELDPHFIKALNTKACLLIGKNNKDDEDQIKKLLEKSKDLDPQNPETLCYLGKFYLEFKKIEIKAFEFFKKSLKIFPDYCEGLYLLSKYHQQRREYDLAEKCCKQAIKADVFFVLGWVQLATVYGNKGSGHAFNNISVHEIMPNYMRSRGRNNALSLMKSLNEFTKKMGDEKLDVGEWLSNTTPLDTDKILKLLNQALLLAKDNKILHHLALRSRAEVYQRGLQDEAKARDDFWLMVQAKYKLDSFDYHNACDLFNKFLEYDKIVQCTSLAIESKVIKFPRLSPTVSPQNAYFIRGDAYFKLGEFDKAQEDFECVLSTDISLKNSHVVYLDLYTSILVKKLDYAKGIPFCQKGLSLCSDNPLYLDYFKQKLVLLELEKNRHLSETDLKPIPQTSSETSHLEPSRHKDEMEKAELPTSADMQLDKKEREEKLFQLHVQQKLEEENTKKAKAEAAKIKKESKIPANTLKKQKIAKKIEERKNKNATHLAPLLEAFPPNTLQLETETPNAIPEGNAPEQDLVLPINATAESSETQTFVAPPVQENLNKTNDLLNFRVYIKPKQVDELIIIKKKMNHRLPKVVVGSPLSIRLQSAHNALVSIGDLLHRLDSAYYNKDDVKDQNLIKFSMVYHVLRLGESLGNTGEIQAQEDLAEQAIENYLVSRDTMRKLRNDIRSYFPFISYHALLNLARALVKSSLSHNLDSWLGKKLEIVELKSKVSDLELPVLCQELDKKAWNTLLSTNQEFVVATLFKIMKEDLQTMQDIIHVKDNFVHFWREGDEEQSLCKMIISNLRKCLVIFRSYQLLQHFDYQKIKNPKLQQIWGALIKFGNQVGHDLGEGLLDFYDEIQVSQLFDVAKQAQEIKQFIEEVQLQHFSALILGPDRSVAELVWEEVTFSPSLKKLLLNSLINLKNTLVNKEKSSDMQFAYAKMCILDIQKLLGHFPESTKNQLIKLFSQEVEGFSENKLQTLEENIILKRAYMCLMAEKAEELYKILSDANIILYFKSFNKAY